MKYRIKIADKTYEMEIERLDGGAEPPAIQSSAVDSQTGHNESGAYTAVNPSYAAEMAEKKGDSEVCSPMPGTILSVCVQNGASVQKGQVVLVLEAMKMENEIQAPTDGIVTGLYVKEGETVQGGSKLFAITA